MYDKEEWLKIKLLLSGCISDNLSYSSINAAFISCIRYLRIQEIICLKSVVIKFAKDLVSRIRITVCKNHTPNNYYLLSL